MPDQLLYKIALTLVPGVGDISAKNLLAYAGNVEAIFKEKKTALMRIPGIGKKTAESIFNHTTFERAEEEVQFIEKQKIKPIFFTDEAYPVRLKQCADSPILFYYKGKKKLNDTHFVSIVGTRNSTDYGTEFTKKLVEELAPYNVCVVSGLAYGIDIIAHKAALKNNVPTVGVLAHGLDRIYPQLHTNIANEMLAQGGLISEFMSGSKPDRENFPKRNRIVAGLCDATIVVEAAKKGGALITADIANSYSRDVFAVPGRLNDPFSEGCNQLIKTNKAALLQSVKDIEYIMGWEKETSQKRAKPQQQQLFVELNAQEQQVVDILGQKDKTELDFLSIALKMPVSKVFALLTTLELKSVVRSLPGKVYQLNG